MFYTSGTTGRLKGIRRAAANAKQAVRGLDVMRHVLGLEPGMRALLSAPMYHSAPTSYSIGAAMESAHLFIEEWFDAENTLRLIEQHRITTPTSCRPCTCVCCACPRRYAAATT